MKVLILGVNGFIGHHLTERILADTDWKVFGMDLSADRLGEAVRHPRFEFVEGDISINKEWIEYHIKKSDVVLPLVAIATPKTYVERPLDVFELDFEENLRVVRQVLRYGKRLVFPSTSEVYGMCEDLEFDEETSPLVLGPIAKERWIYSCSKQLLDRVIWAYGRRGLSFTLFRPFNWVGPRLDSLETAKEGSSRVVTQFIANLVMGVPIQLVDGGRQRRCFTYVDDGIAALMKILHNEGGRANGAIFNIGSPDNDCSIRELAEMLQGLYARHPRGGALRGAAGHPRPGKTASGFAGAAAPTGSASAAVPTGSASAAAPTGSASAAVPTGSAGAATPTGSASAAGPAIVEVTAKDYYGEGYQDIATRKPSIARARERLGWTPRVGLRESLERTLDAFIEENAPP